MGNCLRRDVSYSGDYWADEDLYWEQCAGGDSSYKRRRVESTSGGCGRRCVEKDRLLVVEVGDEDGISAAESSSNYRSSREVKIKISRKELEELVTAGGRGGAARGSTAEQLLARLVISAAVSEDHRNDYLHQQRTWRPALQSIPEVN